MDCLFLFRHKELVELGEEYAAMWSAQLKPHTSTSSDDPNDDPNDDPLETLARIPGEERPESPSTNLLQEKPTFKRSRPKLFADEEVQTNKDVRELPEKSSKFPRKPSNSQLKKQWFSEEKEPSSFVLPFSLTPRVGTIVGHGDTYDNADNTSEHLTNNDVIPDNASDRSTIDTIHLNNPIIEHSPDGPTTNTVGATNPAADADDEKMAATSSSTDDVFDDPTSLSIRTISDNPLDNEKAVANTDYDEPGENENVTKVDAQPMGAENPDEVNQHQESDSGNYSNMAIEMNHNNRIDGDVNHHDNNTINENIHAKL